MYEIIGILGGIIGGLAGIPYVIEIIKGRTKPQRMAWVIFITLSGISLFAQLAAGATASIWFPLVLFLESIVIFILTLKYGMGGSSIFDKISIVLAILIMVVWAITKSPALAIVCSTIVNTIGKILVIQKVYQHPNTEYVPTWVWSGVASALAVVAVGRWDWILMLSNFQNAVTVLIIAGLIVYRRNQLKVIKKTAK